MNIIKSRLSLLSNYLRVHPLELVLFFGILLRVVAFLFQGAFNNDDHLAYVQHIYQYHALPVSGQLHQSNHPPLYYFLASLLFSHGVKMVQALSLAFSIGTLTVMYFLIKKLEFIQPLALKQTCLLFVSSLPQFIMFGNYISNDSLSFFIGALIFLQIYRLLLKPTLLNQSILAILLGLGLSTKGMFLLFIPVLILLVIMINLRSKTGLKKSIIFTVIFVAIFTGLGSYKGINNMMHFGRPIVIIDKDTEWIKYQSPTYAGFKSLYDVNVLKLVKYPVLSEHTQHAYLLMLYASFWYQYLPESDFKANLTGAKYLGSLIYILALLPTFLFLAGFLKTASFIKKLFKLPGLISINSGSTVYEVVCLLLLASNFLVFILLACKYDVYSAFQGRFLFPSLFSLVVLFNSGFRYLQKKLPGAQKVVFPLMICLDLLFILYFGIEIFRKVI